MSVGVGDATPLGEVEAIRPDFVVLGDGVRIGLFDWRTLPVVAALRAVATLARHDGPVDTGHVTRED